MAYSKMLRRSFRSPKTKRNAEIAVSKYRKEHPGSNRSGNRTVTRIAYKKPASSKAWYNVEDTWGGNQDFQYMTPSQASASRDRDTKVTKLTSTEVSKYKNLL